ncbi:MAG: myo-inosose-2 dehydratase [Deltaproteobacteria bacterium]|nr:myo-inosose-2 dehydratase [Deltaproteobacteria bacterium]
MVRIGVNPIIWSNDDLRTLGGDIPLEQCLEEAQEVGFQGIELGHKFPQDPRALRSVLLDHDLELVSGWWGTRLLERTVEEELDAMEAHLNLLAGMGCDVLVLAEVTGTVHPDKNTWWERRPVLHPGTLKRLGEDLSRLAEHTLRRGVRVAYHHHVGTVIQGASEIHALMGATSDAVGLLLDTGHAVVAGVSPEELLDRHGRRICHVHLKDVRPGPLEVAGMKRASFLDAVVDGMFTVPGDGMVDFVPVFKGLAEHRYRGWLVVEAEQDPVRAPPLEYAARGYGFVRAGVRAAGL